DTGATHSLVSRRLAQRLRVPLHPDHVIWSLWFNRYIQIESGVFSEIEFGSVQLTNVSMLVSDLSHFSQLANHVDAIIGSDLLTLNDFSVDYHAKKVFFSPFTPPASPMSLHPLSLVVELQVQGRPIEVLVDSGIEGIVMFEERLRSRIPQVRIIEGVS